VKNKIEPTAAQTGVTDAANLQPLFIIGAERKTIRQTVVTPVNIL
jgi:hypothetical protein